MDDMDGVNNQARAAADADDGDVAPEAQRKGHIFADFLIMCGVCGRATPLDVPKRRFGAQRAVEWGWKHTQADGWVCPTCKGLWISPA